MSRSILLRTSLAAIVSAAALAPLASRADVTLPANAHKVTSVEGITEYALDNGLHVLLFPDPSKMTATVNITYLVGSRHEGYGETGMAHLLEHMVFKGTPKYPNIPQELTKHGARPNGSTWFDRTNYFESFRATDENLAWAIDLEADRMVNSFIAKKDLDSEMTVVRNEFEVDENNPAGILEERLLSTAFLWHHYGNSTIGARSDVEKVPIENLQAFYRKWYQPDTAVLTIAGRFDESKALALVSQKFGAIPKPTRVIQRTWTEEPTQDGERTVTLRRVGDTQEVALGYHITAGSSPEFPAIDILSYVLGDAPSGRLYKALVETRKASSVSCEAYQLKEPGEAICSATMQKTDNLEEVRDILTKVVEDTAKNPPTKEEVERARASYLKAIDLQMRDAGRVGLTLSEWIAMGDWRLLFLHRDRLKTVTSADVAAVAAKYLKSSNRTTAIFIPTEKPDRSEIPAAPDVAALLKDFKGGEAIAAGEMFDPAAANIESRTHRPAPLNGGLKIALLPKKTRGSTVYLNLTLRFGDEKSLFDKDTASGVAGSMLSRGTAKHTRQQLEDEQDKIKSRISVGGNGQTASVSIETTRENLPAAFRLAVEQLREPAFPDNEFDTLRNEWVAGLEQQKSDPIQKGSNAAQRHLNPWPKGDVRYVSTPDEDIADIKAAKLADGKQFWKDFYGASNGELAVVGDFDEAQLTSLAKELLEGWKSPKTYARVKGVVKDVSPMNQSIETPDKTSAFWTSGQRFAMQDSDPDFAAMVLGNFMLGGGFLNSRLATRIREKDGLSYGVGSYFSASGLDKDATFGTYAIYNPNAVEKLEKAFSEEIARALDKGFTAEEIAEAKDGWLQSRMVARSNDNELVRSESTHLFYDRTYAWDDAFEKKVDSLTADQIKSALKKHIDWKKFTIVKAGDFAAAKKPGTGGAAGGGGAK